MISVSNIICSKVTVAFGYKCIKLVIHFKSNKLLLRLKDKNALHEK